MFYANPLAEKASAILLERTEQRLEALLSENRAKDPSELPQSLQRQILERATLEAAATMSPSGNLEMLRHGFRSLNHPAFVDAMDRMVLSCKFPGDALEMARGIHAAVVLASWGLPVAPFDLNAMRIKATSSNDIDVVQDLFSAEKGAYVGYNTCDAPFYVLLTDCVNTLRQLVPVHPSLAELRQQLTRRGASLPQGHRQPFTQGMGLVDRQVGDAISTVLLSDPHPMGGSITLYAGWRVNGKPYGAPNEGYLPVPGQLLRAVVNDPRNAWYFWRDPNTLKTVH